MAEKRKKWTGNQVQRFKHRMGLSLTDLAAEIGVSKRTVANWLKYGASLLGTLALLYLQAEHERGDQE